MKEVRFDYDDGVTVYLVPDDTVISEYDAEYDAEQASIEAGTYPPTYVPGHDVDRT